MSRIPETKWVDWENLPSLAEILRKQKKTVVTSNGCFDLLHWGHIKYLAQAKLLGDTLVVGINSDRSVRGLNKGPERPIYPEKLRALQVAGLESVDYVFVFDQDTPENFLEIVRPQIHVKGADYLHKPIPEQAIVEKHGGKIELIPFVEGFSTTTLISALRS